MAADKSKTNILIVDDEKNVVESLQIVLEDKYMIHTAFNGVEALKQLEKENIDIVLLDVMMPEMDGIEVLSLVKKKYGDTIDVIMVTALKTVKDAIQAIKLGAYDYITKPFEMVELLSIIEKLVEKRNLKREISYLRSEMGKHFGTLVGNSSPMKEIYSIIEEVSKTDTTVLIQGESGTGKELVAHAVHHSSKRQNNPFVIVDCASIPSTLIESELFGYEKGAFTGANEQKLGRFELANEGTLFFDEVGNLTPEVQAKILRVLENREINRLGSTKTIHINVRIIAATNIDLKKAVEENKFREDLYYRLNVVPIELPPLRERKEDIPLLAEYFRLIYNREFGKKIKGITDGAAQCLLAYNWPGNVRELRNIMERLVALVKDGKPITELTLPFEIILSKDKEAISKETEKMLFKEAKKKFEREFIVEVLKKTDGNQHKAARLMGIHRNSILYIMGKLKIKSMKPRKPRNTHASTA